jgi:glutathione S-transferase
MKNLAAIYARFYEATNNQSSPLPYGQRAMISLTEKEVVFERIHVDLSNKPDWFKAALGKTPVLKVAIAPFSK